MRKVAIGLLVVVVVAFCVRRVCCAGYLDCVREGVRAVFENMSGVMVTGDLVVRHNGTEVGIRRDTGQVSVGIPLTRMAEELANKCASRGEYRVAVVYSYASDDSIEMADTVLTALDEYGVEGVGIEYSGVKVFSRAGALVRDILESDPDAVVIADTHRIFFDLYDALRYYGLRLRVYWIQTGGNVLSGRLYGEHSIITRCPHGICGASTCELLRWMGCDAAFVAERLASGKLAGKFKACYGSYVYDEGDGLRAELEWLEN